MNIQTKIFLVFFIPFMIYAIWLSFKRYRDSINPKFSDEMKPLLEQALNGNPQPLMEKAESGNAEAQFLLGLCYKEGTGVPFDYTQAVHWYRKAAEQGYAHAQCNLGWCYRNGAGVPQDDQLAAYWYKKACLENMIAEGALRDMGKSCSFFTESLINDAYAGDADSQYNLGVKFYNGEGVKQDLSQAVEWFTRAARQGEPYAQKVLNDMGLSW